MEDPPLLRVSQGPISLEGNALLDAFRLMRQSIPRLQESGIPLAKLIATLADAPDTTGAGTFGELLHADALAAMASALLEVDATVLDPVVAGTSPSFVDPATPFRVPSLIVAADPAQPDAIADPEVARHYADLSDDVEVRVLEGAGHLMHDEKASRHRFLVAVTQFFDRVAPS